MGAGAGASAVGRWKPRRRRRHLHRTTPPVAERHVAEMIGTAIWESLHRGRTDIPAADVVAAAAGAEIVHRGTALRLRRVRTRSPRAETRVVDAERPGVCKWELRHRARSSTPAAGADVAGLALGAGRAVVVIRVVLAGELRAGSR